MQWYVVQLEVKTVNIKNAILQGMRKVKSDQLNMQVEVAFFKKVVEQGIILIKKIKEKKKVNVIKHPPNTTNVKILGCSENTFVIFQAETT